MEDKFKRRLFLGGLVTLLASAPFALRYLRRPTRLADNNVMMVPVSPGVSPSGQVALSREELSFVPFDLPQDNIRENSITACISPDKKVMLTSYSFGDDWKAKIVFAKLSQVGIQYPIGAIREFDSYTRVTDLAVSDEIGGESRQISFLIRSCHAQDSDETFCKEALYRAPIAHSVGQSRLEPSSIVKLLETPNDMLIHKHFFSSTGPGILNKFG